jgi:ABC-type nickel/cobalt efflux system permease component RcnA
MTTLGRISLALASALSLAVAASYTAGTRPAEAHPLGEFAVDRLIIVSVSDAEIRLRYVLDLAEFPALEEIRSVDRNGDNLLSDTESEPYLARRLAEIQASLQLEVDGRLVQVTPVDSQLILQEGQGGLKTMRLIADYRSGLPDGWQDGVVTTFTDNTYNDRLGWQQMVVQAGGSIALMRSIAPNADEVESLIVYPPGQSPPPLTNANLGFQNDPSASPTALSKTRERSLDRFASLVSREQLTPAFVAMAILGAMVWGAAHAVGPGHGKTIVAAYLVGSSATPSHAVLLGLTVTLTHTASVIALGLLALFATNLFPTEDLYVWLSIASGLMVVAFGGGLLASRTRAALRRRDSALSNEPHGHSHAGEDHGHAHDHDHGHDNAIPTPSFHGLIYLGISGGIVPCPTALVVMLGAIALDRIAYGFVLIFAFSVGLAAVLTGIGLALLYARRFLDGRGSSLGFTRWPAFQLALRTAPVISALVITIAGLVITGQAISDLN